MTAHELDLLHALIYKWLLQSFKTTLYSSSIRLHVLFKNDQPSSVLVTVIQKGVYFTTVAYPSNCVVQGTGLQLCSWWDHEFEFHWGHGCLSLMFLCVMLVAAEPQETVLPWFGTLLFLAHPECENEVWNETHARAYTHTQTHTHTHTHTVTHCKVKLKQSCLQAWSGPEGSRNLRFPDFMTVAQDGGKVVSLTHWQPLPPGNTHGTHFC